MGESLHELINCLLPQSTPSHILCPITQVLKSGNPVNAYQTFLSCHNGNTRSVEYQWTAVPDTQEPGVLLLFRDITDLQQYENEYQRINKLHALEVLAGGIANQFDSLLTTILGNIFVAKLRTQTNEALAHGLQEAEQACLQAKDVTKQLLTFARHDSPRPCPVAIGDMVRRCAVQALSGSPTGCQFHIPENLWHVQADEAQLKQVVHNIVYNARQAMPNGGLLTLRGENVTIEMIPNHPSILPPNQYVKLEFEDQGKGITPEHLSQIFDPYFTTRPDANGLGLAIAHSIVQHHQGHICVNSKPGGGTTISVYIPKFQQASTNTDISLPNIPKGEGRILVMDDDMSVLTMVQDALTQFGYEATSVQDGNEAISIYTEARQAGQPFSVILLDLIVQSGMGGKEALEHLLKIDPQIKAIITSGYSDNPIMTNFREYGFSATLIKPYTISKLHQVLQTILHSTTSSSPS